MTLKIRFKKIPRLAIYFYLTGFMVIGVALILYKLSIVSLTSIQLTFIGGAIVVSLGSVINSFAQFSSPQNSKSAE